MSSPGGSTSLPLARVKTIMKSSPEVSSISQEALHLTGKATELFIQALAKFSYQQSGDKSALKYSDLAEVVNSEETLQFLHDIVPRKIKAKDYLKKLRETAAAEEN
ncbi:chromatin accessibility complex protein 1 [Plakobranchus ocellatus]|uniref:Chromatin accessibility complex protein 1 n=1 Tax=Plakobranchus ocellatus TaxID=259542 RepID=A0AAV4AXT8_9GAST|nr:chromatin accessibility complex protein 1 [Plakobranchus ocellatus]